MFMQHGHAAWACRRDMLHGHGTWSCSVDMQRNKQHVNAALNLDI
jgi:hypothetical protein